METPDVSLTNTNIQRCLNATQTLAEAETTLKNLLNESLLRLTLSEGDFVRRHVEALGCLLSCFLL